MDSNTKMPWFRFYHEAVDDAKLRLLAFEDRWHFVALLCCKAQGILEGNPETLERRIAVKLGVQLRELDEIKRRLMEVDLIDSKWEPVAWDKRQFISDHDPTRNERQKRYRERQKNLRALEKNQENQQPVDNNGDSNALRNASVTPLDTDTDTERDKENTNNGRAERDRRAADRFAEFWSVYPRKVKKPKALEAWMNKRLDSKADAIIADVKARKLHDPQWQRDPSLIPHPPSYLNAERWTDEWQTENRSLRLVRGGRSGPAADSVPDDEREQAIRRIWHGSNAPFATVEDVAAYVDEKFAATGSYESC